ncbi:MAG: twin-arginine translocation signal domain-containing protein, partial [Polaromonas sp.]|nr:twin-arginine translocation signal domain-containing protein [Polaromonas sp.]
MSQKPNTPSEQPSAIGRRNFLNKTAVAGLAGAGLSIGLAACTKEQPAAPTAPAAKPVAATESKVDYSKYEVPPGQLDTYYSFSSGGHSGEMRIYGLPSGRLFKRIPVFNIDCLVGWGVTNESKKIMGTNADGSLKYFTGDTHHVHPSYTDGTYNGKHIFV